MQSTFSGIEIGKRSLFAHQVGIHTIGHNLSNIETEGYSRQKVNLSTHEPLYAASTSRPESTGQVGQGVNVAHIRRVKDEFIERRIIASNSDLSYWQTREQHILAIEQVYNEPTNHSIRKELDRFWSSWQDLSLRPYDIATRNVVVESGNSLTAMFRNAYNHFNQIGNILNDSIVTSVNEVNSLLQDISRLNNEISKVIASGNSPNDLMDIRDKTVEQLSEYIQISTSNQDLDDYTIYSQGLPLVQGAHFFNLDTIGDPTNEGYANVVWQHNGEAFTNSSGSINALLQLRDIDLHEQIDKLDSFVVNFTDLVNEIHRAGTTLDGSTGIDFFTERSSVISDNGNYDSDGDGVVDSTYLFRINGTSILQSNNIIGIGGVVTLPGREGQVNIQYTPNDTVQSIIDRINHSESEIKMRLNRQGQLQLVAGIADEQTNPNFVIRSFSDSGRFLVDYAGILAQSGVIGQYDWQQPNAIVALRASEFSNAPLLHPSGWMGVNDNLNDNPLMVVASVNAAANTNTSATNGEAALAIGSLRNTNILINSTSTADNYFSELISDIGVKSKYADIFKETHADVMNNLITMRDSVSGVNIDEEVAELIKFQHGYSAAARFVSNIDQMLDTIINRMGV